MLFSTREGNKFNVEKSDILEEAKQKVLKPLRFWKMALLWLMRK